VATEQPAGLAEFEAEVRARMTECHLLDILKRTNHWSGYTRHFGPLSGSDPKLVHAVQRYLFTVFCYGCNHPLKHEFVALHQSGRVDSATFGG